MNSSIIFTLVNTLIFAILWTRSACGCDNLPIKQYDALRSIYYATNGPDWRVNGTVIRVPWTFPENVSNSSSPCSENWEGLTCTCNNSTGEFSVRRIYLEHYNLNGSIPSSIVELTYLKELDFSYNINLSGSIPENIGSLKFLNILRISFTSVNGSIPSSIGELVSLTKLELFSNQLTSSLPSSIGDLVNLEVFTLFSNKISGSIPSSIGTWSQIKYINMYNNRLTGSLPNSMSNFDNLVRLDLSKNSITGTLPTYLSNLKNLIILDLSENRMNGFINSALCNNTIMQYLYLGVNNFTGTIPTCLGYLSLNVLNLGSNNLTGSISDLEFGSNNEIKYFAIDNNMITGTMPSYFCYLYKMEYLYINNNFLNGTLPSCIGNSKLLRKLSLNNNFFTGTIPTSITNLVFLNELFIFNNFLTGSIPFLIGNLDSLVYLYLNNNSLNGTLPSSLGNLRHLVSISLFNNNLYGEIPTLIGNLTTLRSLYLNDNSFSGTIPPVIGNLENITGLYLNDNNLKGSIPSSLGNLRSLQYLFLNNNGLTGTLPSSLGNMRSLVELWLYSNDLVGTIPSIIGSLNKLSKIQLNNNSFTGPFFNIFNTSDTETYEIASINIEDNLFTGSIFHDFTKLPNLVEINGVSNCFQGTIPSSICSLSQPNVSIIFDVAGSNVLCAENLELNQFLRYRLAINTTFSNLGLQGALPACILAMPNLEVLRLSGNQLRGVIPDLANNSALSVLTLNSNKLTGTIPVSVQEHPFSMLSLSRNRLHGTLVDSFVVSSTQTSLSLAVNRLSGPLPPALKNQNPILKNLNTLNVLASNMFMCTSNEVPLKDDIVSYSCGSYDLNVSYAVFFTCMGFILLLCVSGYVLSKYQMKYLWLAEASNQVKKWYIEAWSAPSSNELKGFFVSLLFVRNFSIMLMALSISVLLPIYLVLNLSEAVKSSIVTYSYGYAVTITFLHGNGIVIFMTILLFIVLAGFRFSTTVMKSIYFDFFEVVRQPVLIHSDGLVHTFFVLLRVALFQLTNLVVTVIVNAVYVNSILKYEGINQSELAVLQLAIGFFKAFWNSFFIPLATSRLRKFITTTSAMQSRYLMSIVNFIIAPCIATIAVNQSCFYYVFVPGNSINIPSSLVQITCDESISERKSLAFLDSVNCTSTTMQTILPPLYPPFHYSYACGSALLIYYIPVLAYTYVFTGLAIPFIRLNFAIAGFSPKYFDRIFCVFSGFHPNHVRGPNILVDIMVHMTLLLTFGLAAPVLLFEIALVLFLICGVSVSLTGRIYQIRPSCLNLDDLQIVNSIHEAVAPISTNTSELGERSSRPLSTASKEQQVLEGLDIHDSWRSILACADMIVVFVVSFWAFLFFDMIADQGGPVKGVMYSLIFCGLMCVVILGGSRLLLNRLKTWPDLYTRVKQVAMKYLYFNDLCFEHCSRASKNCANSQSNSSDGVEFQSRL